MAKYRTASGKEIDMEKLALRNEEVRAVGNMGVNARGDIIDSGNKKVASRSEQVNKAYRKQIGNVPQDIPVGSQRDKVALDKIAREYKDETITGLDEGE